MLLDTQKGGQGRPFRWRMEFRLGSQASCMAQPSCAELNVQRVIQAVSQSDIMNPWHPV